MAIETNQTAYNHIGSKQWQDDPDPTTDTDNQAAHAPYTLDGESYNSDRRFLAIRNFKGVIFSNCADYITEGNAGSGASDTTAAHWTVNGTNYILKADDYIRVTIRDAGTNYVWEKQVTADQQIDLSDADLIAPTDSTATPLTNYTLLQGKSANIQRIARGNGSVNGHDVAFLIPGKHIMPHTLEGDGSNAAFAPGELDGTAITPATLSGTAITPATVNGTAMINGTIKDAQLSDNNLYPQYLGCNFPDAALSPDDYAVYNAKQDKYLHPVIEESYLETLHVTWDPGDATVPDVGTLVQVTVDGTATALNCTCDGAAHISETILNATAAITVPKDSYLSAQIVDPSTTRYLGTDHRIIVKIWSKRGGGIIPA